MSEDMHLLLGRYFSGQVTEQEERTVKDWAQASGENAAEFKLLQELWDRSGEHDPVVFDTQKAWRSVDARIKASPGAKVIPLGWSRVAVGIVAAVALVVLFAGIWYIAARKEQPQTVLANAPVQEILLKDGSRVYLREGSSLQFPKDFDGKERRVSLTGEAFFEVHHNPAQPFVVAAEGAEVRVLGTSFSVNTQDHKVELIVKTGRVNFSDQEDGNNKVLVTAGERALLENHHLVKRSNTDENFNAWQSGELKFTNTPLPQVAAAIGGYYKVHIQLRKEDAPELSASGVTASFNRQTLAAVLNELSQITSYHIRKLDETNYEISIK